jgi:hypothetical protein
MRRGLQIATAAVVLLVPVAPAGAAIVVDRSIAGVAPGMTRAQAEATLGAPLVGWFRSSSGVRPDLARAGVLRYRGGVSLVWDVPSMRECAQPARARTKEAWSGYVRCALAASPASAVVPSVVAPPDAERTAGGVGVGSTLAEVKRALPSSASCVHSGKATVCLTRGRDLQTRVVVARGRVSAIELRRF